MEQAQMTVDSLLSPLSPEQRRIARREVLRFQHRLAETGLFDDATLAALIDRHPRSATTIRTLRPGGSPRETWVTGAAGKLTGAQLLKLVSAGHLEVRLEGVMTADAAARAVFDRMIAEFQTATGLTTLAPEGTMVLSSPNLAAPARMAIEEAMSWHVRGPRLVYAYPPARDPVAPWMDLREEQATPVMLDPGQAIFAPLHSPLRPINGDGLNVSVEVAFATPQSRMADLLRRMLGRPALSTTPVADEARFDVTAKGLVWRSGEAPFWAPQSAARSPRKRSTTPKLRKAA